MDSAISEETRPLLPEGYGAKLKPTPLPKLQIGILMCLQLAEPIAAFSIYPYINQLISELDITGGDEKKVGYYAGLIESIFFATQAVFVFQWSRLSDHIGRKPVLLIGLGGMCISMICFGLSKTFTGLVVSRSIVGILNGNSGVMKSMIGEITDPTNIARGFAWVPVAYASGVTIGPLIGGQLAKPHDRWPRVFSHPIWTKYPYFLPCAVAAAFAAINFLITVSFLKETIKRRRRTGPSSYVDNQTLSPPTGQDDKPPPIRAVLTRRVVISIANYGTLALIDIAYLSLLPLFFTMPISLGGLGFTPSTIGLIMGALGILDGIFQGLFFARAIHLWGPKRVFQLSFAMFFPLFALFPVMNLYAKAHGIDHVLWALLFLHLALIVVMDMAFGAIFLFITSSAPGNRSLGAVNGVAQFIAAVTRAIGPAASTSLFSTALERNWLGGYAVYGILIVATVPLMCVSTLLPMQMWPKDEVREQRDG